VVLGSFRNLRYRNTQGVGAGKIHRAMAEQIGSASPVLMYFPRIVPVEITQAIIKQT
jgi:hypothetical protein